MMNKKGLKQIPSNRHCMMKQTACPITVQNDIVLTARIGATKPFFLAHNSA
jgi:hypothetical protein